jgi:hypothetical protein
MSLRGGIKPEKEGRLAGFLCLQIIPVLLQIRHFLSQDNQEKKNNEISGGKKK